MPVFAPKPCKECGTVFTPRGPCSKFCSDSCYRKANRTVWRDADRKSRINTGKTKYPEAPGSGAWQKLTTGTDHHTYTTGLGIFQQFRKDACERCGSKRYLCAHHKDRDRTHNVAENIETLCKSCHQEEHGAGRHLQDTTIKGRMRTANTGPRTIERDERGRITAWHKN